MSFKFRASSAGERWPSYQFGHDRPERTRHGDGAVCSL